FSSGDSIVENVVRGHYRAVDNETNRPTRSMICVPLSAAGERLGVMQVLNKRKGAYTSKDCRLLEEFGSQAALAIRNARLVESLLAHSGFYAASLQTSDVMSRLAELRADAWSETLTILFADMRGFTQLCQTLIDPRLVQSRLSEFIRLLSDAILTESGIVNKFLGDGVLAIFRGDGGAERGVRTAFAILEGFDRLKQGWNDESNQQLDFLDVGIGLVTDQVILGGMGGSQLRDFTAIGTAVNLCAVLEKDAREGRRILCDQLTFRKVQHLDPEFEGPENFVLQKPGQSVGVAYKRYHLRGIRRPKSPLVFISHSDKDRELIGSKLVQPLEAAGLRCWVAKDSIPKGNVWTAEIRKGIAECSGMLVAVTQNSAKSRWVQLEVDLALAIGHQQQFVIPIIFDGTDPGEVNSFLAALQGIDARVESNLADQIARRIKDSNSDRSDS
ncbi:MAG: TIR domain-containing protein, partial [Verrucomicrobiae bacterium]|nr:TIR domain-containing protein [Verrucomicrobiae bacterium]